MDAEKDVTIRVTIEMPRQEYTEDFYIDRAEWEAMSEDEQATYVDTEFYPTALSNAGIGGSYEVVTEATG
jgi:hypothetical protein